MRELLLKLRKGADASLTLPKLTEVLRHLGGWTVEPTVGFVQIHHDPKPGEDDAHHLRAVHGSGDKAVVEAQRAAVVGRQVRELPSLPVVGRSYVTDVSPLRFFPDGYPDGLWSFTYREWVGADGVLFVSPEGKRFVLLPSRYDLKGVRNYNSDGSPPALPDKVKFGAHDVLRWLKANTRYLEQVNDALGTEEHVSGLPRTREGTGTCCVCYHNVKLDGAGLAFHGYRRPGHGGTVGRCRGADFPPYERSADGCRWALGSLRDEESSALRDLRDLGSATAIKVNPPRGEERVVRAGDSDWSSTLAAARRGAERRIEGVREAIREEEEMVSAWRPMRLPVEGDLGMPAPLSRAFRRWVEKLAIK